MIEFNFIRTGLSRFFKNKKLCISLLIVAELSFFDDRNVSSLLKYFTFGSKQRVFKQRYNRHRSYATGHGCNE